VAGAIWLAAGAGCQDEQGMTVIGRSSWLRQAGFEDVFTPKQSADDWLHDR